MQTPLMHIQPMLQLNGAALFKQRMAQQKGQVSRGCKAILGQKVCSCSAQTQGTQGTGGKQPGTPSSSAMRGRSCWALSMGVLRSRCLHLPQFLQKLFLLTHTPAVSKHQIASTTGRQNQQHCASVSLQCKDKARVPTALQPCPVGAESRGAPDQQLHQ